MRMDYKLDPPDEIEELVDRVIDDEEMAEDDPDRQYDQFIERELMRQDEFYRLDDGNIGD
jgi:hypothetical protein